MLPGEARSRLLPAKREQAGRTAVKTQHRRLLVWTHRTMSLRARVHITAANQIRLTGDERRIRLVVGQLDDSDGPATLIMGGQRAGGTTERLPAIPKQSDRSRVSMDWPAARLTDLCRGGATDSPTGITQSQHNGKKAGNANPHSLGAHSNASSTIIQPDRAQITSFTKRAARNGPGAGGIKTPATPALPARSISPSPPLERARLKERVATDSAFNLSSR
jgi:hypothetical protein